MNKMKKALLGTALAGAVVVGASAGTYAWFNAEYTNGGSITNHTLTLTDGDGDKGTEVYEALNFGGAVGSAGEDATKLAPGRTVSDSFSIENSGTMNQILRANLDIMLKDASGNVMTPNSVKGEYTITASGTFKRGATSYPFNISGDADTIDQWLGNNKFLPDADGLDASWAYFKPGDKLDVKLDVKLKESAGNEYQGATISGGLEVDARQTDANSKYLGEE